MTIRAQQIHEPNDARFQLHPDAQALLAWCAEACAPPLASLPLDVMRQTTLASIAHLEAPGEGVASVSRVEVPRDVGPAPARFYEPQVREMEAALLFLHGGGWVLGDLDSHDALCRYLCNRLRIRVVALDYRRAPEHPFPEALDDADAAARWLATSPGPLGGHVSGVVLCGDSAGGNLAAAAAARLSNESGFPLVAQMLLYPVLDLVNRTPSYDAFATGHLLEAQDMAFFKECYVPDAAQRGDPRVSPLLAPALAAPPTVIVTAGLDVLRDEGRAYAGRLCGAGIETHFREAAGLLHGFATMRRALPSGGATLDRALEDLGQILARTSR